MHSSPPSIHKVALRDDVVPLFKILKFEGLAQSGADAKQQIADGLVRVNGEVETRKRRQIRAGDIIVFAGQELRTVAA